MVPSLLKVLQYGCLHLSSYVHLDTLSITQISEFINLHCVMRKAYDFSSVRVASKLTGISGSGSSCSDEIKASGGHSVQS